DDKRQSEQQTECPDIPSLEKIDTSFWKTKDKVWKDERQSQWPAIERVVKGNRRKTDVNVIKQYFLRGKMPKWESFRDWDDMFRHLDLNMFLWLHPSSDLNVLKPLYKLYMESNLIHWRDVTLGYGLFLKHEFIVAPSTNRTIEEYPFPYMGDKNIVLFRIMFGDLDYAKNKIKILGDGKKDFENREKYIFEFMGYHHFFRIGEWLLQDQDSPFCKNCLYQYDDVLEWCLTTLTKDKENEFR
ncbi:MAG: hypothetical protein GY931_20355, partial [Maribacter sp.]|nr:hypothetical protein [Maribacter sp.]